MRNALVVALLVLITAACDNGGGSGPVAPGSQGSSATAAVETFTGTVAVGGSDAHPFTVALSGGQLAATLTAVGPPATIFMGLGIGSWTAPSTCTLISGGSVVTQAGTAAQLSGVLSSTGSFCVAVFDVGNQTDQVSYSVTVSHF